MAGGNPQRRRWQIASPFSDAADVARSAGTAPLVAQILYNRGLTTAQAVKGFISPRLNDLHDPELMPNVDLAAERIVRAITNNEAIVIYGDYDVDGMTGLTILRSCLTLAGANVKSYVPHRLEEGYGVNAQAVRKLAAEGAQLLITVDCGISAIEPLAQAAELGLDVIVTDHHQLADQLPQAIAVVHPGLPGSLYPNPDLCGAGVAFKLAWQVAKRLSGGAKVDDRMREFLLESMCLAALGTIADVVPLTGENRVFATFGLRALPQTKHIGLRALLASAGLDGQQVDAYHVGFVLAPRLNACGRMGHAALAVELLTEAPPDRAAEIADYLCKQNTERQTVEREIAAQAAELAVAGGYDQADCRGIVLDSADWHGGVIGIVASRLVDRFHRPTVLISWNGDGLGHGSARSVPGFNMHEALSACAGHLESFGGHAMAGGLKIRPEKVEDFRRDFLAHAAGCMSAEDLCPVLKIDAQTTVAGLSYNVVEHIERLAPFGQGNPTPVVALYNCRLMMPPRRMGQRGNAVSLTLQQNGASIRAVGFGMGDLADTLVGVNEVDVAAEPVINRFNGKVSVELKLRDVVVSQERQ